MKAFRNVCIVLGVLHAVVMIYFASGPELAPLMVLIVDAPVAHFTQTWDSEVLQLGVPIAVCSVLYPSVIYLAGVIGFRAIASRREVRSGS
jgi:hypothetical protein